MKNSIIATVTVVSLYAASGAAFAAGSTEINNLSNANTEVSYSAAVTEQVRLNNIGAPVDTKVSFKNYSVDEDESFATRKAEQARLKYLEGKEYKQLFENKFKPVSADDAPRGTAWAENRRS